MRKAFTNPFFLFGFYQSVSETQPCSDPPQLPSLEYHHSGVAPQQNPVTSPKWTGGARLPNVISSWHWPNISSHCSTQCDITWQIWANINRFCKAFSQGYKRSSKLFKIKRALKEHRSLHFPPYQQGTALALGPSHTPLLSLLPASLLQFQNTKSPPSLLISQEKSGWEHWL